MCICSAFLHENKCSCPCPQRLLLAVLCDALFVFNNEWFYSNSEAEAIFTYFKFCPKFISIQLVSEWREVYNLPKSDSQFTNKNRIYVIYRNILEKWGQYGFSLLNLRIGRYLSFFIIMTISVRFIKEQGASTFCILNQMKFSKTKSLNLK